MSANEPQGTLRGLKVLDLSRVLAGPLCTQMLSDHGAEVIKVEPPSGDETRGWGPPFKGDTAAYFFTANRNKRSLALDISAPEGREIILRLLEDADVLVENFKLGTLERWGLGYEEVLRKRFPRLVHCTITGFGAEGPFGGFPGYDLMAQAWVGLVSINGSPDSGPLRMGIPLVDLATGTNAALGIMMALHRRATSGQGQHVEIALYDIGVSLLANYAAAYFVSGRTLGLMGNTHPSIAPYSLHRTSGRSVFLGAANDRQFQLLCKVLGQPEMGTDPRFLTNKDRVANMNALREALEAAMQGWDGEELAIELNRNGVSSGAVQSVPDALNHAHTAQREMVVELDGYKGIGIPLKMSDDPGRPQRRPPHFGEHSREILREAGYEEQLIEQLVKGGIIQVERGAA